MKRHFKRKCVPLQTLSVIGISTIPFWQRETKKKTTSESTMIASPSRLISFYSEFIVVSTFEMLLKYVFIFSFLKNSAIFQTHIMFQLKYKKLKCSLTYSLTSFSSVNFGFISRSLSMWRYFITFTRKYYTIRTLCVLSYLLLTNVYLRGML